MRRTLDAQYLWCYGVTLVAVLTAGIGALVGCVPAPPLPPTELPHYVGAAACTSCHPYLKASHDRHGHAQALKVIEGRSPIYPDVGVPVGVPDPPDALSWFDLYAVIGGYRKGANFVDAQGYLLTDGTAGVHTQYNLATGPAQLPAGYVSYLPDQTSPLPFTYDCFRCHTTGPLSLADSDGSHQGNRPGIEGTWAEDGVQCEACHGPGSNHLPNPSGGTINIDGSPETCGRCHVDPQRPDVLTARDGLVFGFQQATELAASPHRGFACTVCHNPHASSQYDVAAGIRNQCVDCHPDQNLAIHEGFVFQWGDYTEPLTCESCHMPYLAMSLASRTLVTEFGQMVRIGDTRSHIFKINTLLNDPLDMFTPDGSQVALDADGRAGLASCSVCLRCHHGKGNAFALELESGCAIGTRIHQLESAEDLAAE